MFLPATDADVPRIVDLMNRAYRGSDGWSAEQAYIAGDRTTEAFLREDIAANPAATLLKWVETPDGPAHGCVWLEPMPEGTWYLGSLCVDPDLQNAGQGIFDSRPLVFYISASVLMLYLTKTVVEGRRIKG